METNRQTLYRDYEQSLFRLAVYDAAQAEGALDGADTDGEGPDPAQLARFMQALEHREKNPEKPRKAPRFKLVYRLAASAAVLLVVFLVCIATVDAFRLEVLNLLIRIEPKYTLIRLEDGPAAAWDDPVPTYVPQGYEVTDITDDDHYKMIVYSDIDGGDGFIIFHDYDKDNQVAIDTENADYIRTVTISGEEATVAVKDNITNLVWAAIIISIV
jgi:hypothetical protein